MKGYLRLQKNIGFRHINVITLLRNDFCVSGPLYRGFVYERQGNATFWHILDNLSTLTLFQLEGEFIPLLNILK